MYTMCVCVCVSVCTRACVDCVMKASPVTKCTCSSTLALGMIERVGQIPD